MASEVDISNLALAHLGDVAQVIAIKPPDPTVQAGHCGRFYPIARNALLEMHPWPFAVKRETLAQLETNPQDDDWSYAYRVPATCLRPLSLLSPGTAEQYFSLETDAASFPYLLETAADGTTILYTNVPEANLRFIDRVTESQRFSPLFVTCLARLLASMLAGPILKGEKGAAAAEKHMKLFYAEFRTAAASAANQGKRSTYRTRIPAHLAGRGSPAIPDAYILRED